jgi:predicted DsbA family dithiol-disulfide isomerase
LSLYRERFPDADEPAVRWLPFQLNPDIPAGGMSRQDYIVRKFGPGGRNKYDRVAAVGREVGISFEFDKIQIQPNTVNAHRLIHHAGELQRQDEVAEALFHAYFVAGENLADLNTLADIGARAGLDRAELAAYLASDADEELVQSADSEARNAGVQGVPFFIFNHTIGVSGAQEAETLLQAMLQAIGEDGA